MIKIFIISLCLFVSNCAYISYNQVIPLARNAILGVEKIKVDENLIESTEYSFARVNLGRSASVIMILEKIDSNNNYHWISSDSEKLITSNGKIIKTRDLIYNFEAINYSFNLENSDGYYDVMFYDPKAFIEQRFEIKEQESEGNLKMYTETIFNTPLKTSWKNIYKVNDLNFVIYSKQRIHPNLPEIEMDIYYKF
tara:strand:- start:528 stop:1115 length:588 start_codon:yes stop_codon:yes gene_type:complete